MELMGADVVPVREGSRTLKDAVTAALKHWVEHLETTHYLIGSAVGPYPYPLLVEEFQSVIGREVRRQITAFGFERPDVLVACVGGGSNALGLFGAFLRDPAVRCVGVEAGGRGKRPGEHAVRFGPSGRPGIVQGYLSYFLQDRDGQILPTHSVSAGLDYAGVSPILADLRDRGRVDFASVTDRQAIRAYRLSASEEGIIPALESAHALAYGLKAAGTLPRSHNMVICVSGRGDKDLFIAARILDTKNWKEFLKAEARRAG